jgi:hypothetical protein
VGFRLPPLFSKAVMKHCRLQLDYYRYALLALAQCAQIRDMVHESPCCDQHSLDRRPARKEIRMPHYTDSPATKCPQAIIVTSLAQVQCIAMQMSHPSCALDSLSPCTMQAVKPLHRPITHSCHDHGKCCRIRVHGSTCAVSLCTAVAALCWVQS